MAVLEVLGRRLRKITQLMQLMIPTSDYQSDDGIVWKVVNNPIINLMSTRRCGAEGQDDEQLSTDNQVQTPATPTQHSHRSSTPSTSLTPHASPFFLINSLLRTPASCIPSPKSIFGFPQLSPNLTSSNPLKANKQATPSETHSGAIGNISLGLANLIVRFLNFSQEPVRANATASSRCPHVTSSPLTLSRPTGPIFRRNKKRARVVSSLKTVFRNSKSRASE